jgi:exonuclease III
MKICGSNCHGLNKPASFNALLDLHKRLKPDVFFLSETHLMKVRAENMKSKPGYDHMLVSARDGRSGGLMMLWRTGLNVTSSEIHTNFLDIPIDENSDNSWRITGFSGEPSGDRKHLSWDYI